MRFVRTAENLFGLPAGFQRTEYLESTGTQYIDTGVLPVNDMAFECKFTFTSLVSTNLTIVGSRDGEKRCQPIGVYNNKWSASIGGSYDSNGTAVSVNTPYIIKSTITNGQTITTNVNGSQTSTCTSTTGLPSQELYIFARNFYGNTDPADSKVNGKLYFLKIKANGVLVRDFIPCIDQLGVPCMYDLVERKPYYNAGSGTFTVGRQVIPVEYLETDGTSFINTGYTPSGSTETEITTMLKDQTTSRFMFGCRTAQSSKTYACLAHNSNRIGYRVGDGSYIYSNGYNEVNTKHTYKIANGVFYRDDVVVDTSCQGTTTSPNSPLALLTINTNNVLDTGQSFIGNFYSCTIKENDILVRDFIPCKDENNVGFMFDKVSGTCYLNAGTGAFSVGEPVYTSKLRLIKDAIRIPAGYTRVEYIESSGTQYIDTGVYPTQLTEAEYRCAVTGSVSNNDSHLFGSRLSASSEAFDLAYMNTTPNGLEKFRFIHGTTTIQETETSVTASQIANPHTYYMSGTSFKVDGSEKMSFTTASFTGTYSLWLFGVNSAGSLHNQVRAQRVYKCKIWNNGTLVRSFIPVRDENNVGYMFDEVTGQLFGNAGSGSFGIGNDLPTAKVRFIQDVIPSDYIPLKYLESTGTQYINTGLLSTANSKVDIVYGFTSMESGAANNSAIFGGRNNTTTNTFTFFKIASITPQFFRFDYNSQPAVGNATQLTWNTASKYRFSYNGSIAKSENITTGESYSVSLSPGSTYTTSTIVLFAENTNGNVSQFMKGRIYKYWYTDGTNTIDLYPALRKSDNKPGMYDRITKQFFVNSAESGNDFNYE